MTTAPTWRSSYVADPAEHHLVVAEADGQPGSGTRIHLQSLCLWRARGGRTGYHRA